MEWNGSNVSMQCKYVCMFACMYECNLMEINVIKLHVM